MCDCKDWKECDKCKNDASLVKFFCKLIEEVNRADEKHGDWKDADRGLMIEAIDGEFNEVVIAFFDNDVEGEHGMKNELLQVACTAFKMWRTL